MSQHPSPDWWNDDNENADDDPLVKALLPQEQGGKQRAQQGGIMDDGRHGMPQLDDAEPSYTEQMQNLQSLESAIARLENDLQRRGAFKPENLAGDDDEDDNGHRKKRFMTISDLPPSPLFFGDYGAEPLSPRPDAVVDTGRRLKDGASFSAIRAPILGISKPLYIHDLVGPLALVAGLIVFVLVSMIAQQRRTSQQLKAAEDLLAAERLHHQRMLHAAAWHQSSSS